MRIGELSRELDKSKGGRPAGETLPADGKSLKADILALAGISTSAAHRAYIWGSNNHRRHMTKGQIAMIAAVAYVAAQAERVSFASKETLPRPAAKAVAPMTERSMLPAQLASLQRASPTPSRCKSHAPTLVAQVIEGPLSLDAAYNPGAAEQRGH